MTWDEYTVKFLASKGFDEKDVAEKIKNNEHVKLDEESKRRRFETGPMSWMMEPVSVPLSPAAQEVLESLKDRWFQADTNPEDQLLNEQEFLSFLHPEHSRGMLRYMVKEIVRDLGPFLLLETVQGGGVQTV